MPKAHGRETERGEKDMEAERGEKDWWGNEEERRKGEKVERKWEI